MRTLAQAYPNPLYFGIYSINDLVMEARIENNKIVFFETHTKNPDWVVQLKEETVRAMFPKDVSIHDTPFIRKDNRRFWVVLNKHKFPNSYKKIKHEKLKNLPQEDI
jgi:hypothetical protein